MLRGAELQALRSGEAIGTRVQSDHSSPLGPVGSLTANLHAATPTPPHPPTPPLVGAWEFHGPAGGRYGKSRGCRKPRQKCP